MVAMNLAVRKPMSLAEFLEWEERQELRYEFDGVEPSAMTGGSLRSCHHPGNLAIAIGGSAFAASPASSYGSDLKIRSADNQHSLPGRHGRLLRLDPSAQDRSRSRSSSSRC